MTPQQDNAPDFSKAGKYGEPLSLRRERDRICAISASGLSSILENGEGGGIEDMERAVACLNAMQGIADPAQWVKAVEELEVEINHYISCGKRIYDCPICSGAFEISLAKLQSARGGKE